MNEDKDTVTLLAGGDINADEPVDELAELIVPVLQQADLRFGQCEKLYTERPIVKPDPRSPSGPHGKRPIPLHPRSASIFKTAGIDIISLASNHTMDWGGDVLMDSVELLRGMGKNVIGVGKDIAEARTPAIITCNGVKIAFLGYCSVLPDDHDARTGKAGIAPMRAHTAYVRGESPHEEYQPGTPPRILTVPYDEDLKALQEDMRQAKKQADVVVMSIHWGLHHIPKTIAAYQPVVAHAAIDAGADLILGHHPHCLKAVEVYKGKVCFYSIGNFMTQGSGHSRAMPSERQYWNFYYYRVDPECMPPKGKFNYPSDARKTMLAKAVFSKKGVDRISFLPAFINPRAQPAVVAPSDPKFHEVLDYIEWLSEEYPHKFRVEGNEVVVEPLS